MSKHREPDNVTHDSYGSIPFTGIGPTIYRTTIKDGNEKFTGTGYTPEEADQNAGEKYSDGDSD